MKLRSMVILGTLLLTLGLASTASALPSYVIHVTTTAQGDTRALPVGQQCSLQEAIYSADFKTNEAIDALGNLYTTQCESAGGGTGVADIVLPANSVFQFGSIAEDLNNRYGPTATPVVFSNITIEGNGSTIEPAPGSPAMRAFVVGTYGPINISTGSTPQLVSGTGNLTIENLFITGFVAKGGDGGVNSGGGGGGLGAGGAIYVDASGSLTVLNSTFEGNGAVGGNGGRPSIEGGGGGSGGGGLGGNGGLGAFEGSGGGGGGAQGAGGAGLDNSTDVSSGGGGGGGGGTVDPGEDGALGGAAGGLECGGHGGTPGLDSISPGSGAPPSCAGGGGGGGGSILIGSAFIGGNGAGDATIYGSGGGGGGFPRGSGGNGGFGGGGGSGAGVQTGEDCGLNCNSGNGGNGGFGGGGGGADPLNAAGIGGEFAGDGSNTGGGGGGAALGGAIFNDSGIVLVQNSTFFNNFVDRGIGGSNLGHNGTDAGGAIFSRNGSLTVQNATISGNQSTGTGAGIVVVHDEGSTSFKLQNTIIYGNGTHECFFQGSVTYSGVGNLIGDDFGCTGLAVTPSPDPQLGALQINAPGVTPTMAIQPGTPAVDVADVSTSLSIDQRGVSRPQGAGFDVGAFEAGAPAADLVLSKAVSSSTAQIGDTLTYTLTVTNLGPQTANSVQLSDTLPASLTFVSCSATGGGLCGGSGNSVTVTYTTLAANAPVTITLQATLNSGIPDATIVTNNASVSATSPLDPNSTNNAASASFAVQNKADLVVTKSVSAKFVEVGDQVTYTVKLTNNGPYAAKSVALSDTAPSGVTFNSCSSTVGACNLSAGVATLSLASFANGASATMTIQATLNFGVNNGATITNTAAVTAGTFDPNTGNNSASASFTAENRSDLLVTNLPDLILVKPGTNLTYFVTVWNLGPFKAKDVVLTDPIPLNTTFVLLKSGGVPCTSPSVGTAGTVTCNVGSLALGAWATVTITVKVGSAGSVTSITNTATATAATFDPFTPNNSARVITLVTGNKK